MEESGCESLNRAGGESDLYPATPSPTEEPTLYHQGVIRTASPMDRVSPGRAGVRVYDKGKAYHGYTLFSTAFGYTEYLIDMNGLVIHTWPVTHSQYAEILPDGDLLVDNYGYGLQELAPDGREAWSWKGDYHHDFERLPNGNTILLIARSEPVRKGFYAQGKEPDHMRTDVVLELDRSGRPVWEFSFGDHIEELHELAGLPCPVRYSRRDHIGVESEVAPADWAHTNTIELLPDTPLGHRDRRFRAGNLLFSFRALDLIGVIDRKREEISWAWGLGILDGQHQPTMLGNGNILLFDNGTYRGQSAVIEMNPQSSEIVWRYEQGPDFYSPFRSGVQRLENGNTLICESDAGRIFEVTPHREIVWDYWSPFLGQGPANQGRHVYRATRYTEQQVSPVLDSRTERITGVADMSRRPLSTFREALRYYQNAMDP